jgi:RNA polymerase sigma-70 factor (ECF subfamily)
VYDVQVEASAEDVAAVRGARSGDREAFGVLVERYQEVAFRAAYLVVRDAGLAEDVAQEAFLRAYGNLGRFDVGQPFRPWLLRIVTNLALNEVRARGRRRSLWERVARGLGRLEGDGSGGRWEPGPERSAEAGEQRELLSAALGELSEGDRLVLYLRYYLELPEVEIATVIGKRPGTVKSRLHRASGRLRAVIERRYPGLRPEAALRGGDS